MAKAQLAITMNVIRSGPVKWGYCRACNARIEWVKTEKGRLMPVDWPLHPLRELERHDGTFVTQIDARQSHFVTCPNAEEFRRKKR